MRWTPALRPEGILVLSFAVLIAVGTVLLRLPMSQTGATVGWVDCLFISTSAVCVTGLASVDAPAAYSTFGMAVIAGLIQLGGLGIMTFAAAAFQLFRARVSVSSHAVLHETYFQPEARVRLRLAFRGILFATFFLEAVGALLIYLSLPAKYGGWFNACFLAISAFCNAGFATYSSNLIAIRDYELAIWTIAGLIVVGGIGYTVIFETGYRFMTWLRRRKPTPLVWSLNAKVVIRVSAVLIFGGGLALAAARMGEADGWSGRLWHGLFQSISARTAGFNTLDLGKVSVTALLILIGLMFIGGSPGSCAGGIKTTSLAVGAASAYAGMVGHEHISLFGRRIPQDVLQRTGLVIGLAILWQTIGLLILVLTESVGSPGAPRLEEVLFEQVSAFNTVGLSTGVTLKLSTAGKLWITLSMFAGRLGPLTMALAVFKRPAPRYQYPVERVMIG